MTTTANPLPAANSRLPFCLRRLGETRCSLSPSGLGSLTAFGNMRSILSRILSNQRMKTTRLILLAMLSALLLAVTDITPTPLPPPVSLKEAVRIFEDYVAEKKIFCPLAERLYGKRLLVLYFVSGVLGEIFGYVWSPNGAGSSLGIAGVIGGLFAFTFLHSQEITRLARILAIFGFAGALALCFYRDTHGPPMVIGALLASLMTILWPKSAAANHRPAGQSDGAGNFQRDRCRQSASPAAAVCSLAD